MKKKVISLALGLTVVMPNFVMARNLVDIAADELQHIGKNHSLTQKQKKEIEQQYGPAIKFGFNSLLGFGSKIPGLSFGNGVSGTAKEFAFGSVKGSVPSVRNGYYSSSSSSKINPMEFSPLQDPFSYESSWNKNVINKLFK